MISSLNHSEKQPFITTYLLPFLYILCFFYTWPTVDSIYSLYVENFIHFHAHPHHLIQFLPLRWLGTFCRYFFTNNQGLWTIILSELLMIILLFIDYLIMVRILRILKTKFAFAFFRFCSVPFLGLFFISHNLITRSVLQIESYGFIFPLILLNIEYTLRFFLNKNEHRKRDLKINLFAILAICLFHQNGIILFGILWFTVSCYLFIHQNRKELIHFQGASLIFLTALATLYYLFFQREQLLNPALNFPQWFVAYKYKFGPSDHGSFIHFCKSNYYINFFATLIGGFLGFSYHFSLKIAFMLVKYWFMTVPVIIFLLYRVKKRLSLYLKKNPPLFWFLLYNFFVFIGFILFTIWWASDLYKWYIFTSFPITLYLIYLFSRISRSIKSFHRTLPCTLFTLLLAVILGFHAHVNGKNRNMGFELGFHYHDLKKKTEEGDCLIITSRFDTMVGRILNFSEDNWLKISYTDKPKIKARNYKSFYYSRYFFDGHEMPEMENILRESLPAKMNRFQAHLYYYNEDILLYHLFQGRYTRKDVVNHMNSQHYLIHKNRPNVWYF